MTSINTGCVKDGKGEKSRNVLSCVHLESYVKEREMGECKRRILYSEINYVYI